MQITRDGRHVYSLDRDRKALAHVRQHVGVFAARHGETPEIQKAGTALMEAIDAMRKEIAKEEAAIEVERAKV